MASAEKTVIEKVVKTEEPGFLLELTEEEAKALFAVTMRVGGSPDQGVSSRAHIDNIRHALMRAALDREIKTPRGLDLIDTQDWAGKHYESVKGGTGIVFEDYDKVGKR